jgi:hypothetical protein
VRSQQNEVRLREKVNFPKALVLVNKGADYRSGGSELVPFGGALPNIFLTAESGGKIPELPSVVQNSCPALVLDVHISQFSARERAEMSNLKSADKNVFVSLFRQGFQRARFHQPSRLGVG